MKLRRFPALEQEVSEISLGCWQLGGDFGRSGPSQAREILKMAFEQGINLFDTADVYGGGSSERFVGEFSREVGRGNVVIATKVGRSGELHPDKYTEEGVRRSVEASLRRLKTDVIDVIQLHCVPPGVLEKGEIFGWLRSLKQAGKIRTFGASVETVEEAGIAMRQGDLASLQIILNIFRQKPVERLLDEAQRKQVAIIVRLPLASGLLGGKMTKKTVFEAEDHRNYNRDGAFFSAGETFAGLPFETGIELADEVRKLVPGGASMAQFSQRWILDHPQVTTLITGASRPEQVRENAAVSESLHLDESLHEELRTFYEEQVRKHLRITE